MEHIRMVRIFIWLRSLCRFLKSYTDVLISLFYIKKEEEEEGVFSLGNKFSKRHFLHVKPWPRKDSVFTRKTSSMLPKITSSNIFLLFLLKKCSWKVYQAICGKKKVWMHHSSIMWFQWESNVENVSEFAGEVPCSILECVCKERTSLYVPFI